MYDQNDYYTENYSQDNRNMEHYQNTVPNNNYPDYDSVENYGNSDFNHLYYKNDYQNHTLNATPDSNTLNANNDKLSTLINNEDDKQDTIRVSDQKSNSCEYRKK